MTLLTADTPSSMMFRVGVGLVAGWHIFIEIMFLESWNTKSSRHGRLPIIICILIHVFVTYVFSFARYQIPNFCTLCVYLISLNYSMAAKKRKSLKEHRTVKTSSDGKINKFKRKIGKAKKSPKSNHSMNPG